MLLSPLTYLWHWTVVTGVLLALCLLFLLLRALINTISYMRWTIATSTFTTPPTFSLRLQFFRENFVEQITGPNRVEMRHSSEIYWNGFSDQRRFPKT